MSTTKKVKTEPKFKVGDTAWLYDANLRRYRKDANGKPIGSPIQAQHYRRYKITSIEPPFYRLKDDFCKTSQRIKTVDRLYRTTAECETEIWKHDHLNSILDKIRTVDTATLQQIAELIGYVPDNESL